MHTFRELQHLRGVAVIKAEGAAEPLLPMNSSLVFPSVGARDEQLVVERLMISLCVVSKILAYRGSQGVFSKKDPSFQTFLFDRLDEPLGESIQVW